MTTAANRILAVLALVLAGVALPVPGQEPGHAGEPASTDSKRFSFGFLAGVNHTPSEERSRYREGQVVYADGRTVEGRTRFSWNQPEGWLVGGFVELDLGARFSVQAGLSYVHAYMWDSTVDAPLEVHWLGSLTFRNYRDSLQLPVTLNYRLGSAKWRPVIGAGPAFRSQLNSSRYGAVALFGVEGRMGRRWTIAPQVRYFRWAPGDVYILGGPRNRVQALVVVSF